MHIDPNKGSGIGSRANDPKVKAPKVPHPQEEKPHKLGKEKLKGEKIKSAAEKPFKANKLKGHKEPLDADTQRSADFTFALSDFKDPHLEKTAQGFRKIFWKDVEAPEYLLKRFVNFALKGEQKEIATAINKRDLIEIYQGISDIFTPLLGFDDAREFLSKINSQALKKSNKKPFTSEEINEVIRITKNRKIAAEYAIKFSSINRVAKDDTKQAVLNQLKKNIEDLDNPKAQNVICLENGTTTFSIPGGHAKHYISYEFQKDSNGNYYFLIHNRGAGANDEHIHGNVQFDYKNRTYRRTTACFQVPQSALLDEKFLVGIIENRSLVNMKQVYDHIKNHLLDTNKCKPIISEYEKLYNNCTEKINKNKEKINKIKEEIKEYRKLKDKAKIKNDPILLEQKKDLKARLDKLSKKSENLHSARDLIIKGLMEDKHSGFHSLQSHGTCPESNSTAPEKAMASNNVLRALKCFTISGLVDQLVTKCKVADLTEEQKRHALQMAELGIKRQHELQAKIK